MDFRFSQFEIFTGAGTMLLTLFFVCLFSEVGAVENEIGAEVNRALEGQDLYWSSVEVEGQGVVLTGSAPDRKAKLAAAARAAGVDGVSSVENLIEVIGAQGDCQKELDEYLTQERITFRSGRIEVADSSLHTLGMLAMIVRSCDTTVEVAGHTDDKGDAEVNLRLSQRRAEVVAKHLVRHGVLAEQIVAVGYGETQPIADNADDAGRKANRRIEFRVLGGSV
ncbi:MAG: OmpA family protein [Pseudomonadota bacterium]